MRRLWIVCVALVLLSGCTNHSNHSSAAQEAASKKAFVQQLVGYCAQVDRQMTSIDEKSQPGQVASQLQRFTSQARSHPPPSAQRQQFDTCFLQSTMRCGNISPLRRRCPAETVMPTMRR